MAFAHGKTKKEKKNRVFEATMTENLTKLMTNTNPQIPNVKETYINQDKELLKTYVDIVESNCRGLKTRQILKEAVVGTPSSHTGRRTRLHRPSFLKSCKQENKGRKHSPLNN